MEQKSLEKATELLAALLVGEPVEAKGGKNTGLYEAYHESGEVSDALEMMLKKLNLRVYEYNSRNVCTNEFGDLQDYTATLPIQNDGEVEYTFLPESFTILTTDYHTREEEVYAARVMRDGRWLKWAPVEDENHCYYRVYRGKTPDFRPASLRAMT